MPAIQPRRRPVGEPHREAAHRAPPARVLVGRNTPRQRPAVGGGNHGYRDEQRSRVRDRHRDREILEELALEALHEQDGQEDRHTGQHRGEQRGQDFARTFDRRMPRVLAFLHEAQHVALYDQRGVDDDTRQEREARERDDVERAPEHVHRDDREEERDRDRCADHQQRARSAQEVPQSADGQQDAYAQAFLDEPDGTPHVDARVPRQVGIQLFLRERAGIQLCYRLLDAVDDLDGVRVGRALQRDVVGGHAAAVREPERLDVLGADVGDVAQVQRTVVAPADHQVAEVRDGLAARDAYGELPTPDIGEGGRHVTGRNDGLCETLRRQAERGEAVRVEGHTHLARAPAFEVDAGHAGHAREPRLDDLLHQLLVLDRDVRHGVPRQRADQQRSGVLGLEVVAAEHLRLFRVGRQRRQRVETRHHVEHDPRHVSADLERQLHTAATTV